MWKVKSATSARSSSRTRFQICSSSSLSGSDNPSPRAVRRRLDGRGRPKTAPGALWKRRVYTRSAAANEPSRGLRRRVRKSRRMSSTVPARSRRADPVDGPAYTALPHSGSGIFHEAHLPAKEAQARPHARFPCAYEYPRGQARPAPSPQQGPRSPHPVTVAEAAGEDAGPARPARRKRRRLSRSGEFDRVYREGRSHAGRHLILYAFPRGAGDEGPRLGISVGRRVGGAVERNRVKRALRESFWACAEPLPETHDFVIVARPEAGEAGGRGGRARSTRGAPGSCSTRPA